MHQIFELWFKLIIHELVEASELLEQAFVPEVHLLPPSPSLLSLLSTAALLLFTASALSSTRAAAIPLSFLKSVSAAAVTLPERCCCCDTS